jgi:hypothetical protein
MPSRDPQADPTIGKAISKRMRGRGSRSNKSSSRDFSALNVEIDMPSDSLKKLHTSLVDNRKGYVEAAKDPETPSLKALFSEICA